MPIILKDLTDKFGLTLSKSVKWGESINSAGCGLYFVTITSDPKKLVSWDQPEIDSTSIDDWIELVRSHGKEITIDNQPADQQMIMNRFSKLWLRDETILYIGKAGPNTNRPIRKRVNEYYKTKLGCNKKHAGGHWINVLSKISQLNVFHSDFSESDYHKIEDVEEKLIGYFSRSVSESAKETLIDSANCFPFANKEIHLRSERKKVTKAYGFGNQTVYCGSKWKK